MLKSGGKLSDCRGYRTSVVGIGEEDGRRGSVDSDHWYLGKQWGEARIGWIMGEGVQVRMGGLVGSLILDDGSKGV